MPCKCIYNILHYFSSIFPYIFGYYIAYYRRNNTSLKSTCSARLLKLSDCQYEEACALTREESGKLKSNREKHFIYNYSHMRPHWFLGL